MINFGFFRGRQFAVFFTRQQILNPLLRCCGRTKSDDVLRSRSGSNKINNSSTASLTAKVMQQTEQSKKRKMDNENVKSLFSNRDQTASLGNSAGFMTRGFSHVKR